MEPRSLARKKERVGEQQQGERKEEGGREIFTMSMYGKKEQESRGEMEKNSQIDRGDEEGRKRREDT